MSFFSAFLGLFSCNAQSDTFKSVDAATFAKLIADTAVVRLDVRTAEVYAKGHIEGAINIDVSNQDFESKATATLPKEKTIALYGRTGKQSKQAARILAQNGYEVIELSTGYPGTEKESFADIIKSNQLVLVDFYATWCGPCRIMHPILEQLEEEVGDSVRVVKVDVDQNEAIARQYRIQSIPTLMLFKGGEVVWRQSGIMRLNALKKVIEHHQ